MTGGFGGSGSWQVDAYTAPPPAESLGFRYEIFINGNLEHSVLNTRPEVFENVRAELANGVPDASSGSFRNFQVSTVQPERPVQPVEPIEPAVPQENYVYGELTFKT